MAREQEETRKESESTKSQPAETSLERRRGGPLSQRRERFGFGGSPFSLMRRLSDDVDRLFDDLFGTRLGSWEERWPLLRARAWSPEIDVFERDGKLVVRADLPGLTKADVNVEVRENELVISGERKSETEREEGEFYVREASYGRFHRAIPLPEGVKSDTASATFDNGVLTVELEAPSPGGRKGRRIDVREGSPH
jgi:HSP20 family protein